ncbi:MAG: LuxR C-terminal-related transcriptional regulator [Bacteroidales bacterium]
MLVRLNLSSKEIATLMNISPKSVEIARYRLRKKLGLRERESMGDLLKSI